MKRIATFATYGEANERQLDLMAADIDAMVEYVPNGWEQAYFGALPIYALLVPEELSAQAVEVIRLIPDENHRCLFRCPQCDSNNVEEDALDQGFGTGPFSFAWTLGTVALLRMVVMRTRGRKYRCLACGAVYRKKP